MQENHTNGDSHDDHKRAKTARACDSCRRKKIRCQVIEGSVPPMCTRCRSKNLDCTWYLPISETRPPPKTRPADDPADKPPLAKIPRQQPRLPSISKLSDPNRVSMPHSPLGIPSGDDPLRPLSSSSSFLGARVPSTGSSIWSLPVAPSLPAVNVNNNNTNGTGANDAVGAAAETPRRVTPLMPASQPKRSPNPRLLDSRPHSNKRSWLTKTEPTILGPTAVGQLLQSSKYISHHNLVNYNRKYLQRVVPLQETIGSGSPKEGGPALIVLDTPHSGQDKSPSPEGLADDADDIPSTPTSFSRDSESRDRPASSSSHQLPPLTESHSLMTNALARVLVQKFFSLEGRLIPVCCPSDLDVDHLEEVPPLLINTIAMASSHADDPMVPPDLSAFLHDRSETDTTLIFLKAPRSVATIQALMILCLTFVVRSSGLNAHAIWAASGLVLRYAQALGLHRKYSPWSDDIQYIELRRRLWGIAVIIDRWYSLIFGLPMLINLGDCDCMLPSLFDVSTPEGDAASRYYEAQDTPASAVDPSIREPESFGLTSAQLKTIPRPFAPLRDLIMLSVILGRIMQTLYNTSVDLMRSVNDVSQIYEVLRAWQKSLSPELVFEGVTVPCSLEAGFLHVLSITVKYFLVRPISRLPVATRRQVPIFETIMAQWPRLVIQAREAIVWVSNNAFILDSWVLTSYSLLICGLVQFIAIVTSEGAAKEQSLPYLTLALETFTEATSKSSFKHQALKHKLRDTLKILHNHVTRTSDDIAPHESPKPFALDLPELSGLFNLDSLGLAQQPNNANADTASTLANFPAMPTDNSMPLDPSFVSSSINPSDFGATNNLSGFDAESILSSLLPMTQLQAPQSGSEMLFGINFSDFVGS